MSPFQQPLCWHAIWRDWQVEMQTGIGTRARLPQSARHTFFSSAHRIAASVAVIASRRERERLE